VSGGEEEHEHRPQRPHREAHVLGQHREDKVAPRGPRARPPPERGIFRVPFLDPPSLAGEGRRGQYRLLRLRRHGCFSLVEPGGADDARNRGFPWRCSPETGAQRPAHTSRDHRVSLTDHPFPGRSLARRAPSARVASLAQVISGLTTTWVTKVANPQSVPAMTFSAPTRPA